MLMGAAIGAVVGLAIYFIQQQQKKKAEGAASDQLDSAMKSSENAEVKEEATSEND
jgi:hypothetical protein